MTIRGLIRKLEAMEKKLGPRARVVIRLEELRLIDAQFSHWEASECQDDFIPWGNPDESRLLADGTERMRSVAVLG